MARQIGARLELPPDEVEALVFGSTRSEPQTSDRFTIPQDRLPEFRQRIQDLIAEIGKSEPQQTSGVTTDLRKVWVEVYEVMS